MIREYHFATIKRAYLFVDTSVQQHLQSFELVAGETLV